LLSIFYRVSLLLKTSNPFLSFLNKLLTAEFPRTINTIERECLQLFNLSPLFAYFVVKHLNGWHKPTVFNVLFFVVCHADSPTNVLAGLLASLTLSRRELACGKWVLCLVLNGGDGSINRKHLTHALCDLSKMQTIGFNA